MRQARTFVARKPGAAGAAGASVLSSPKLADDLAAQEQWLQAKAKSAGHADIDALLEADYPLFERLAAQWREDHPAEVMLSRAAAAAVPGAPAQPRPSAADRANTIIQTAASTPAPIDALARGLTNGLRINRATAMLYGQGARLIGWITPEIVKAGVISDYGVPEAVIDRRALMVGAQRTPGDRRALPAEFSAR